MNDVTVQKNIENLFSFFISKNPNCEKGIYLSAKTNRLLAFEEYIDNLWDIQIQMIVGRPLCHKDINEIRHQIHHCVDKYFQDNIKTFAIN